MSTALPTSTPHPGIMMIRPAESSTKCDNKSIPSAADDACPEVSKREHPKSIICSNASSGFRQRSKAR